MDDPNQIMEAIISGQPVQQFQAMQLINQHLGNYQEGGQQDNNIIQLCSFLIPCLPEFLRRDGFVALQLESVLTMTSILQIFPDSTQQIVETGVVPTLIQLLSCPNIDVRTKAVQIFGLISVQNVNYRNLLLESGVMDPLLHQFDNQMDIGLLRHASKTLSQLFFCKPVPEQETVNICLPTLSRLIYSLDEEILANTCQAFSCITDGTQERIQAVLESGVARRLAELLMHHSAQIQEASIRAVGNIATGDDYQTQQILNHGVLGALLYLLNHSNQKIVKETCWTCSNILAGNREQVQAVINAGIMPQLIHLLSSGSKDVKKECSWCIANALETVEQHQMQYLVSLGCIKSLCDVLSAEQQDTAIINITLESLERILEAGEKQLQKNGGGMHLQNLYAVLMEEIGALNKIESLQSHENNSIYEKAVHILEKYFCDESEQQEPEISYAAFNQNQNQNQNKNQLFCQNIQNNNNKSAAMQEVQIDEKMSNMQINDSQDGMEDWEIIDKMEKTNIEDNIEDKKESKKYSFWFG